MESKKVGSEVHHNRSMDPQKKYEQNSTLPPLPRKASENPLLQIQQRLISSRVELETISQENQVFKKALCSTRERYRDVENKDKHLQAKLYDMTKNIRVTDDDFSTIVAKLGKFTGKLSNFPPNVKSAFKKDIQKEDLVQFFVQHNDKRETESIVALFDLERLDYGLVSVLVEKMITSDIVKSIFLASIHLNPTINTAHNHIRDVFTSAGHEHWIKDIRLKLSRATFDAINKHSYPTADQLYAKTREDLVNNIVRKLSVIYDQLDDIKTRIEVLVDMAIELSLPIRGQDDLLEIYDLYPGDDICPSQIKPIYRQMEKDKIYLGITPVFLANSVIDDEENDIEDCEEKAASYLKDHTLVYQGKAIW